MYYTVQYNTPNNNKKNSAPASHLWSGTDITGYTGPSQAAVVKSSHMTDPPHHTSTVMFSQASSIPSSLCPTQIEVLITVIVTHPFYKMEADRNSYLYVRQFDACVVTEYSSQKLQ